MAWRRRHHAHAFLHRQGRGNWTGQGQTFALSSSERQSGTDLRCGRGCCAADGREQRRRCASQGDDFAGRDGAGRDFHLRLEHELRRAWCALCSPAHTHTHLAPSRRPTDPRASNARTRAEEFIPQTQKKNIRIMKAALLKDVQVLSTPQSRGEQPGVSTHARIPHRSHAAPLRRCGARPEHGLTGCADLAVTAPAKAAGGRAREGGGARAARDGASGRPAAVDRQGS